MLNLVISRLNWMQLSAFFAVGVSCAIFFGLSPDIQPSAAGTDQLDRLARPDPPAQLDFSASLDKLARAGFPKQNDTDEETARAANAKLAEAGLQSIPAIRAVMISGRTRYVLFEWDGQLQNFEEGHRVGDWLITSIDASGVLLTDDDDALYMGLFALATPADLSQE